MKQEKKSNQREKTCITHSVTKIGKTAYFSLETIYKTVEYYL